MQCAVKRMRPTITISSNRNTHTSTHNRKCGRNLCVQHCLGAKPEAEDYSDYENYGYSGLEVLVFA
jgi:hypothetical protein